MNVLKTEEVIKKYEELKTLKAVANYFNVHPEVLRKFFIKNNLQYNKKIIYSHDENFFSRDTEESFYWAGFIAADGNITDKNDFTLSLKKSDYDHILKFKVAINSNAPITITEPENRIIDGIETLHTGSAIIRFRANEWAKELKRFNIIPNKTKTYSIPKIVLKHSLFKHFIRGYFDGDGWFSKTKNRISWGLCGNLSVMQDIKKHLVEEALLTGNSKIYRQKNIHKLIYSKARDVLLIVNYIYGEATIFLNRKYEISKLVKKIDDETIILNIDKVKLEEAFFRLKSYTLMAKEFECCKSSIFNYMKKYNIKPL